MTKSEVIESYKQAKAKLEREMARYTVYEPRHEELRLMIYQINEFLDILENYLEWQVFDGGWSLCPPNPTTFKGFNLEPLKVVRSSFDYRNNAKKRWTKWN